MMKERTILDEPLNSGRVKVLERENPAGTAYAVVVTDGDLLPRPVSFRHHDDGTVVLEEEFRSLGEALSFAGSSIEAETGGRY